MAHDDNRLPKEKQRKFDILFAGGTIVALRQILRSKKFDGKRYELNAVIPTKIRNAAGRLVDNPKVKQAVASYKAPGVNQVLLHRVEKGKRYARVYVRRAPGVRLSDYWKKLAQIDSRKLKLLGAVVGVAAIGLVVRQVRKRRRKRLEEK